jgi:hypothetical protein
MCDRLRNPPGTHRVAASLVERAPQLDTAHHLDPLYNCAELLNCSINLPSSYNLDLIASAIAVRVRVQSACLPSGLSPHSCSSRADCSQISFFSLSSLTGTPAFHHGAARRAVDTFAVALVTQATWSYTHQGQGHHAHMRRTHPGMPVTRSSLVSFQGSILSHSAHL